jgi:Tfp pilus assembly protein PilV
MHLKQVKAFTLMEVVVSMFISTLLIGVAYFLMHTIHLYFNRLDQNSVLNAERQLMRLAMRADMEEADSVLSRTQGVRMYFAGDSILWKSSGDSLLRTTPVEVRGFYTGAAALTPVLHPTLNLVEQLQISYVSDEEEATAVLLTKVYPLKYFVR